VRKHFTPGVALGIVAIILATTGSAVAGSLITSSQIKDGTIQSKDIKKGTIALNRLAPAAQKAIQRAATPGTTGATGATGATGPQGDRGPSVLGSAGDKGDKGDTGPVLSAGNWGVINRNTEGSPVAFLRSGPSTPPLGKGSLNLTVKDGTEKIAFGNEIDTFASGLFANVTRVGFHVYTTGENNAKGVGNMPSITFEVDPNVNGKPSNYSSLVFMPANTTANQWSGYIDATRTGLWGGTGNAFAGTKCDINGTRCTFDELQAYLNDGDGNPASILSVAVVKGKDNFWSGAVDGLRINDTMIDFEETGVLTTTG
jgi:hypothetical protein